MEWNTKCAGIRKTSPCRILFSENYAPKLKENKNFITLSKYLQICYQYICPARNVKWRIAGRKKKCDFKNMELYEEKKRSREWLRLKIKFSYISEVNNCISVWSN